MTIWQALKEAFTGRCRFANKDGVCTLHGYRCKSVEDYERCGKWKDTVLGPVKKEATQP
jgi:hypothetical protein